MLFEIAAARGMFLRAADAGDEKFQRVLFEEARSDYDTLASWPADVREPFLDQQYRFQTLGYAAEYPGAERLIVSNGSEAVGRLVIDRTTRDWHLVDIAVLRAWRGSGIGSALMESILHGARALRAQCVRLSVETHNPARRLYERFGFVVEEEGNPHIAMIWRGVN